MPIIVKCEHCENKAAFAIDTDMECDLMSIRPYVVVIAGQRHICQDIKCLVKELEQQSKNFGRGRLYFHGIERKL